MEVGNEDVAKVELAAPAEEKKKSEDESAAAVKTPEEPGAVTESNVNVMDDYDDDDDDDDDDYLSSKRLKIDEGDDEKSPASEKSLPSVEAEKLEVNQTEANSRITPTEELPPVIDKEAELKTSSSPLPLLTAYESVTPPPVASDEAASTEANMGGDDSTSPAAGAASPSADNSLKVPPLKIICSKGDFSLVSEIEHQAKSNENSNSSTVSKKGSGGDSNEAATEGEPETFAKESEAKREPLKPNTIIIRKTGDNEVYEATAAAAAASSSTAGVTSTRSSSRLANTSVGEIKPPTSTSKRPVRESQLIRNSSRSSLIASPVNEIHAKPSSGNGASKTPDGVGIGLRRKLRSHTRQQQGSGALSPSNTMSNSSTDFLEQGNQEDGMDEFKKEAADDTQAVVASEDTPAVTTPSNSRKRKVRQQAQQQISSENSNDASSLVAAATATTTSFTAPLNTTVTTTSAITTSTNTSGTAATIPAAPPLLQQPKVFLNTNNCIKQFFEIRNEIIKRRELLKQSSVEPKLPQNYEDFCLFKKNYLIKGNEEALFSIPFCYAPSQISEEMTQLYTKQEKERYNLRIRQRVEQDKLLILYEHEVLRCFNQVCRERRSHPYSFCSIIKDDEVYSVSHLNAKQQQEVSASGDQQQDVEEVTKDMVQVIKQNLYELEQKFQKLKDDLIKRQLHESDSLHAVQLMDWQSKLKQIAINNKLINTHFSAMHVPIVSVNNKFELTPIKIG